MFDIVEEIEPDNMKHFIELEQLKNHELIPGFKGRFIHTEHMTIAFWEIRKGSELPEHSHLHEQVSKVLEGRFQLTIGDEKMSLQPGQVAVIPSQSVHSGIALTDCKVMDIFAPSREDYMVD